jgi:hypothetical protein
MLINLRYRLAYLICPELHREVKGLAAQLEISEWSAGALVRLERQRAWLEGFSAGDAGRPISTGPMPACRPHDEPQ